MRTGLDLREDEIRDGTPDPLTRRMHAGGGSKEKTISPTPSQGEHPLRSLPRDQSGRKAQGF